MTERRLRGESKGHTLRVYDRLVAGIFGDLKLLDQREHLRARLQVIVASTPGRHRLLAGFLDLRRSYGLLALLER